MHVFISYNGLKLIIVLTICDAPSLVASDSFLQCIASYVS